MAEVPEHILRRSAEARAKAEGRDVEEVLAELAGEAPTADPAPAAPAQAAPEAPAAAAAAPAPSGNGGVDIAALSAETGVPDHLLLRATRARAKADGLPDPTVAAPPAGGGTAVATTPAPTTTAAAPAAQAVPEGVRTQRLLTVVKAGAIQQVKREPTDKVSVWPHLLAIEFVALLVISFVLIAMSIFIEAPLLEFANFNDQPNPSKAPWYFLGLQELLAYFDPMVAGVLIPGLGLVALMFIPFVDKTPSIRPSDRKLAIMIFTFFFIAAAILTMFGSFFRGPGFNFVFPWEDGIFFDDLLEVLD